MKWYELCICDRIVPSLFVIPNFLFLAPLLTNYSQEILDTSDDVVEFHRLLALGADGVAEEMKKVLSELETKRALLNQKISSTEARTAV
jgi:hypothetical protein